MNQLEESRTTWVEDEIVESAVMRQLLELYPARVTLEELRRELNSSRRNFVERDAVDRAVRDLSGAGLLHSGEDGEEFGTPTRAALRFSELLDR